MLTLHKDRGTLPSLMACEGLGGHIPSTAISQPSTLNRMALSSCVIIVKKMEASILLGVLRLRVSNAQTFSTGSFACAGAWKQRDVASHILGMTKEFPKLVSNQHRRFGHAGRQEYKSAVEVQCIERISRK